MNLKIRVLGNIKIKLKEIIEKEDKTRTLYQIKVLCDRTLNKNNIEYIRRTVAKYREEMGIKSSSKRKRI